MEVLNVLQQVNLWNVIKIITEVKILSSNDMEITFNEFIDISSECKANKYAYPEWNEVEFCLLHLLNIIYRTK